MKVVMKQNKECVRVNSCVVFFCEIKWRDLLLRMLQFRWQLKSHCPQLLPLMFLCLFPTGSLHKKCVKLPVCFNKMVCHLHTFQNWAPLNQDEASGDPDEHKDEVKLPVCFNKMVCHLHTFQNWAPLNQDEASGDPDEHKDEVNSLF